MRFVMGQKMLGGVNLKVISEATGQIVNAEHNLKKISEGKEKSCWLRLKKQQGHKG